MKSAGGSGGRGRGDLNSSEGFISMHWPAHARSDANAIPILSFSFSFEGAGRCERDKSQRKENRAGGNLADGKLDELCGCCESGREGDEVITHDVESDKWIYCLPW